MYRCEHRPALHIYKIIIYIIYYIYDRAWSSVFCDADGGNAGAESEDEGADPAEDEDVGEDWMLRRMRRGRSAEEGEEGEARGLSFEDGEEGGEGEEGEEGEQAARRMRRQMPPPTASLRHVHRQHRSPSRPRATRSTRPRSSQRWDTDAAEVLHGAMQQCGARRAARGTTRHVAHGTRPTRHVAHGMRHAESLQQHRRCLR